MTHLDPTYLRYIFDGLIKGSVHPENTTELPDGLIGLYEEAFEEHLPVLQRQQLLQRFALFALLKKEVSTAFVEEVLEEREEVVLEFINIYSSWFNSPEPGKFQLYHERLKVFVLQKLSEKVIQTIHEKLIARLELAIEEQKADEFERYGLEFLSEHLTVEAFGDENNGKKLLNFTKNETLWERQIRISNKFDWSRKGLQQAALWTSKYDQEENIDCYLDLVQLHNKEQNDAENIVRLVGNNEIDLALERITAYGGPSKEEKERQFILFMLCLMELTLLESKTKPWRKEAIEKLLKHLEEEIPVDHSLVNWREFFSQKLILKIIQEINNYNLNYDLILERSSKIDYEIHEELNPEMIQIYEGIINHFIDKNVIIKERSSKSDDDAIELSILLALKSKLNHFKGKIEESKIDFKKAFKNTKKIKSSQSEKFLCIKNIIEIVAGQNMFTYIFNFINQIEFETEWEKDYLLIDFAEILIQINEIELALNLIAKIKNKTKKEILFLKNCQTIKFKTSTEIYCYIGKQDNLISQKSLEDEDILTDFIIKLESLSLNKEFDYYLNTISDTNLKIKIWATLSNIYTTKIIDPIKSEFYINKAKIEFKMLTYEELNSDAWIPLIDCLFNKNDEAFAYEIVQNLAIKYEAKKEMYKDMFYWRILDILFKHNKEKIFYKFINNVSKYETKIRVSKYFSYISATKNDFQKNQTTLFYTLKYNVNIGDEYLKLNYIKDICCSYISINKINKSLVLSEFLNGFSKSEFLCEYIIHLLHFNKLKEAKKQVLLLKEIDININSFISILVKCSNYFYSKRKNKFSSKIMRIAIKEAKNINKESFFEKSKGFKIISEAYYFQGKMKRFQNNLQKINEKLLKGQVYIEISRLNRINKNIELSSQFIKKALDINLEIKDREFSKILKTSIVIELLNQNNLEIAYKLLTWLELDDKTEKSNFVFNVPRSQLIWETLGKEKTNDLGFLNSLKYQKTIERLNYKIDFTKGMAKSIEVSNAEIKDIFPILNIVQNDSQSLEHLLQMHSLNNLFFQKNYPTEKLQKFNRVLNLQWAIDLKKELDQIPN